MAKTHFIELPDPQATTCLAAWLAAGVVPGLCIWLRGELGSGKTHLVRGVLRALGWQGAVRSPTYSLLEAYDTPLPAASPTCGYGSAAAKLEALPQKLEAESRLVLYHFDLYRMASPLEWCDAGFDDLPASAVRLIEWPERGASLTPPADLELHLVANGAGRTAAVSVYSRLGEDTWHTLESALRAQRGASPLLWASAC